MNGAKSCSIYRSTFLFALSLFSFQFISAQQNYEALNSQLRFVNEMSCAELGWDSIRRSSFGPNLLSDQNPDGTGYRTFIPLDGSDSAFLVDRRYKEYSWIRRKVFYENLIMIDTGNFHLTIDPLFNVSIGRETLSGARKEEIESAPNYNPNKFNNTRGLLVKGQLGAKLSFETYFYENQSRFQSYITDFVGSTGVVPGQGRVKDFKEDAFDYAQSGGYVSYAPFEFLSIQAGHHKHFIGNGYRSLILSDNAFNYPFLRMNTWSLKNKLNYSFMVASLQDLERVNTGELTEGIFRRKGMSVHHLEYAINRKLSVSLSQLVIWQTQDTSGRNEVNPAMFNPVIGIHPAINGLDDNNNALIALGLRYNPFKQVEAYGQFVLDGTENNQYAWQAGVKASPLRRLFLQFEGNVVQPGAFVQTSTEFDNSFTHYNQGLAHILGNGFEEVIFRAMYRYKRIIPEFQINYSVREVKHPVDDASGQGITLFTSQRTTVLWSEFRLSYLLNPATNLRVFMGINSRSNTFDNSAQSELNSMIFFGIKTDLRNLYYDF